MRRSSALLRQTRRPGWAQPGLLLLPAAALVLVALYTVTSWARAPPGTATHPADLGGLQAAQQGGAALSLRANPELVAARCRHFTSGPA